VSKFVNIKRNDLVLTNVKQAPPAPKLEDHGCIALLLNYCYGVIKTLPRN